MDMLFVLRVGFLCVELVICDVYEVLECVGSLFKDGFLGSSSSGNFVYFF